MKIGDLRHRISFQKEVKVPDGYKGHVVTYQTVCVAWASITPLTGRESFYAQQIKAEITHRVRMRYNDKITPEMVIDYKGRIFTIGSIVDLKERHEIHELLCKEEK